MSENRSLPLPDTPSGRHVSIARASGRLRDLRAQAGRPVLPGTARLLARLAAAMAPDALVLPTQDAGRLAAYRARPEANLPFLRLHVLDADPALLSFLGRAEAGFEVLEAQRAGFQFHWRNDLVRAYDEEVPILGRLRVLSGGREMMVEHLVVPVRLRRRVRELRGWFVFDRDPPWDASRGEGPTLVRRSEGSRILRLPDPPARPADGGSALRRATAAPLSRWDRDRPL